MNALYDTLNLLETVPLGVFMLCYPLGKRRKWSFLVSFFAVATLLIFNVVQLVLEFQLEKSVFFSVFLIITWTLWLAVAWKEFWRVIKKE